MEILRRLADPWALAWVDDSKQVDCFGNEWIEIEEPCGFLLPTLQRRKQFLQLDQVRGVLHYDHYRRVIRIQDISLVTSVEEVDAMGQYRWWMTVQDPRSPQVWVIHFPSLERLSAWVNLLRVVVSATKSRAIVSNVIRADNAQDTSTAILHSENNSELLVTTEVA